MRNRKFKPGDKIRCVDSVLYNHVLTLNKIYTAFKYEDGELLSLEELPDMVGSYHRYAFCDNRFVLARSADTVGPDD